MKRLFALAALLTSAFLFARPASAQVFSNATKLRDRAICNPSVPTDGQALVWIAATKCWAASSSTGATGPTGPAGPTGATGASGTAPAGTGAVATHSGSAFLATAHDISLPLSCVAASASTTAYTCTTSPTFVPAAGDIIRLTVDVANTGAATLNVNSSSAAPVKKQGGGTALVANDWLAGQLTALTFNGTNWQMQGQSGNAAAGGGTTIFSSGGNPNGGTFSPQNMSGNSAPSPYVVSASSDNGASAYFSWNAFKPGTADEWLAATGPPAYLEIDLSAGNAAICGNYTIYYNVFGTTTDAPKTWTFQGSNDNSTWATLDTETNVALAAPSTTVFPCSPATTAYRYFKLAITASNGGPNVGISRLYVNAVGVTSGVAGDFYYQTSTNQFFGPRPSGATPVWPPQSLPNVSGIVTTGTTFTTSGCSATTLVGGATAGSYHSGTTGTCTVVVTPGLTAPNGWACTANDLTTPADVITQTASSAATFTLAGTTVTADVINFSCIGY